MSKVNVLMTVYNEETFLSHAIRSCLPHVKSLTIVEGAYRETAALGASLRSTDNTIKIARSFLSDKVSFIQANERSDHQQRNVGLKAIQEKDPNGWLLIIDGDEVYDSIGFKMVDVLIKKMEHIDARAAYFKSLTFVNDFNHFCDQEFPRLFRLTPGCEFVNDNYMQWPDKQGWSLPHVVKSNIEFYHYSFCKGRERFDLKKKWWESRFNKPFHYSWHLDGEGKIVDDTHKIKEFKGRHPAIMQDHPLRNK